MHITIFILPLLICCVIIGVTGQFPSSVPAAPAIQNSTSTPNNRNDSATASSQSNGTQPAVEPSPIPKSPLENIYVNTKKPGRGIYITEPVFKDNKFTPLFNECLLETPENSSSCYQDDKYNDRLEFQITFTLNASEIREAFKSNRPTVETSTTGETIASPSISFASVNDDDASAKVEILYNCRSNTRGVIPLQLELFLGKTDDMRLTIHWQKLCENGFNDKMEFGYLSGSFADEDVEQHNFGQETAALLTVLPNDISTEFYMKLGQAGATQMFLAPYVTSSDLEIASVSIRGNHPQGGLVEGLLLKSFQIGYECHQSGQVTIKANIAIPPFQNISAVWKKDCGGNLPMKLQVGTEEGGFDVVDNGKATPRYMVGIHNIGTEHSEEHMHVPDNRTEWEFFIKNGDEAASTSGDMALHISRISATVERPKVIFPQKPVIYERISSRWVVMERSSYSLLGGSSLKAVMPLVCRSVGESRIVITIPVLGHRELEFGIAKECDQVGSAHQSKQFMLTVNTILWGVGFLAVVVFVIGFLYIRRRRIGAKGTGFEPVSLTER